MRKAIWVGLLLVCLGIISVRADGWAERKFGPFLVNQRGQSVPTRVALKGNRIIGVYFSAHWCGPCRQFTPQLVKFYQDCKRHKKTLEIIFVSSDKNEGEMRKYMKEANMPWLAVPYGSPIIKKLKEEYQITGIPTLIILDANGRIVTPSGRGFVTSQGVNAYDSWTSAHGTQNGNPSPLQQPQPKKGNSDGKRKGKKKS